MTLVGITRSGINGACPNPRVVNLQEVPATRSLPPGGRGILFLMEEPVSRRLLCRCLTHQSFTLASLVCWARCLGSPRFSSARMFGRHQTDGSPGCRYRPHVSLRCFAFPHDRHDAAL